jgi:hypothetical protein
MDGDRRFADLPAVTAQLFYLSPDSPPPRTYSYEPPPGLPPAQGDYLHVAAPIRNARPIADDLSLDVEGFRLVNHEMAIADFKNEAHLRAAYREAEALVRRVTGAALVHGFDHNLRSSGVVGRASNGVREPARRIHGDFTADSGPKRARAELEAAGENAGRLMRRRYALINVWRPIRGPVRNAALALCDARSVAAGDLTVAELHHPGRTGHIYYLRHNPDHRWFYFPAMRTDEALVIKCFDSDPARARCAPHSAFDDPTAPSDAPPRESLEIRTVAVFDA